MADVGVRLTRERLYDLVWSKPIRRLAEEFDVTAVTITAACDEFDVPRPSSGYWTRLAHGQSPPRPSLPPVAEGDPDVIVLVPTTASMSPSNAPRVAVRLTLRDPHPAVETLRRTLAHHNPGRDGMISLRGTSFGATFRVSPETCDRALLILDALARALAERGHQFRFEEPSSLGPYKLEALVNGEAVGVSIAEHTKQRTHTMTASEADSLRRYGTSWAPKYDLVPAGQLILQLHAYGGVLRRERWADGERQRLEGLLGRVVLTIEAASVAMIGWKRAREEQRRAKDEERAQQAREERRAQYRRALGEDLVAMASRWSKADAVRSFLRAVEAATAEKPHSAGFVEWLEWAKDFATSLDPLTAPETIAKDLEPTVGTGRQ